MTDDYQAPRIVPLDRPMGQRAPMPQRWADRIESIAGFDLMDLVDRHGSPLVVFDGGRLKATYERFIGAFRARWPRTRVAYSVKTNYLSAIVAALHSFGAKLEVVSGMEYAICRRLGIGGKDICFNGPWKRSAEIEEAFAQGSLVNLDNHDELLRTEAIAARMPGVCKVGIRVNMEVSYPPWDKFGFNLSSGEALRMARRIHENPRLELGGLHMHIGTYIPNPDQYGRGARALVELALAIREATGEAPPLLDMGGGYASTTRLRGQILPGTAGSPTPEMYADAIVEPLTEARERHGYSPELVVEPGRALVDESADLICTVVAVKSLLGGSKAAIVDAGVNVLPTAYWYDHECLPVNVGDRPSEKVKIFGALCMQIDVLRPEAVLPAPRAGDVWCFRQVGAYNFSQSMTFIYPRPAYLLLRDGRLDVIRRAETIEDVVRNESVPQDLDPR